MKNPRLAGGFYFKGFSFYISSLFVNLGFTNDHYSPIISAGEVIVRPEHGYRVVINPCVTQNQVLGKGGQEGRPWDI